MDKHTYYVETKSGLILEVQEYSFVIMGDRFKIGQLTNKPQYVIDYLKARPDTMLVTDVKHIIKMSFVRQMWYETEKI